MKTIHTAGFTKKMFDEQWEDVLDIASVGGTLGIDANSRTTEELQKCMDEWGSEFTLHFSPWEAFPGDFDEAKEQNTLHTNLERVQSMIPADRIHTIYLDCERFLPETDQELAKAQRLYVEAYNMVNVTFPWAKIVWYADLDATQHRLDLAPKDGRSCHLYRIDSQYATLANLIRCCARVDDLDSELTAFVGWFTDFAGADWDIVDPVLAYATGCMCAFDRDAPLDRVNDVCVYPHPLDKRISNNRECWDAFVKGMNKELWA